MYTGVEPVSIWRLVSPLRYDVLVRRAFFEFLATNQELFHADRKSFNTLLEGHPYVTWFREVNCKHHHPQWLESPVRFKQELASRVTRSGALFESVLRCGFRTSSLVTISTADTVRDTDTGKSIHREYFLSDGAHRIAMMLLLGHNTLLPEQYVVRHRRVIFPCDNTSLILPYLDVTDAEYFDFLSLGYLESRVTEADKLLAHLSAGDSSVLEEVRRLMAIDGRAA